MKRYLAGAWNGDVVPTSFLAPTEVAMSRQAVGIVLHRSFSKASLAEQVVLT
jgi:hypothetical protein